MLISIGVDVEDVSRFSNIKYEDKKLFEKMSF